VIDAQLTHAFANRSDVAKVSAGDPGDPPDNDRSGGNVPEAPKPAFELRRLLDVPSHGSYA
jgi:hypothetical protein